MMELQKGKTEFSNMTFNCDKEGCWYNKNGRCIYNVARLQIITGRACYSELLENYIEVELDYLDWNLM